MLGVRTPDRATERSEAIDLGAGWLAPQRVGLRTIGVPQGQRR
jgi:hypothetical protein